MRTYLAFALLVGATLTLGCSDDGVGNQTQGAADNDTTTTTGSEGAGDTTERGTTAAPSTGAAESTSSSSGSTGGDSTGSGSGSSTSEPTSGSSDSGSDSGSSSGGQAAPCEAGCMVEFTCGMEWNSEQECVTSCEDNLVEAATFSPFCHDAWESLAACLGTLTCDEFGMWEVPTMFPYPCSDADTAINFECEGQ